MIIINKNKMKRQEMKTKDLRLFFAESGFYIFFVRNMFHVIQ